MRAALAWVVGPAVFLSLAGGFDFAGNALGIWSSFDLGKVKMKACRFAFLSLTARGASLQVAEPMWVRVPWIVLNVLGLGVYVDVAAFWMRCRSLRLERLERAA